MKEQEETEKKKPKLPLWLKINLFLLGMVALIFLIEFLTRGNYDFDSRKGFISYIIYIVRTKFLDVGVIQENIEF